MGGKWPLGVPKHVLTTYIYLGMIWIDFIKIDFFDFLNLKKIFFGHIYIQKMLKMDFFGDFWFSLGFSTSKPSKSPLAVVKSKQLSRTTTVYVQTAIFPKHQYITYIYVT